MYKKYLINLLLVSFLLLGAAFFSERSSEGEAKTIRDYAREAMALCSGADHPPSCYEREIPKLMDRISMEDAFEVAAIVQKDDQQYNYCHVLGHYLSGREAAKDPDRWADIIHRCPNNICSNGCLHGAAQERFRDKVLTDEEIEKIKPQLLGVCEPQNEWEPTGLARAECFHGLGHLTMYLTGADIPRALRLCDDIAVDRNGGNLSSLCYEGAFMQLFQPLVPEDELLVEGLGPQSKEELRAYCAGMESGAKESACWVEGWPLYRDEVRTATGTAAFCGNAPGGARRHCYNMLFYVRAQGESYDSDALENFCAGTPEDIRGGCFGDVANAIIHGGVHQIPKALNFCERAERYGESEKCYDLLLRFADYNTTPGSPEHGELCGGLPDRLQKRCFGDRR